MRNRFKKSSTWNNPSPLEQIWGLHRWNFFASYNQRHNSIGNNQRFNDTSWGWTWKEKPWEEICKNRTLSFICGIDPKNNSMNFSYSRFRHFIDFIRIYVTLAIWLYVFMVQQDLRQLTSAENQIHSVCLNWLIVDYKHRLSTRHYRQTGTKSSHCK